MCNNMLQYGHVYAWAREHGRSVMSMRFAYKYQYFRLCHSLKHNFIFYALAKFMHSIGVLPAVSYWLSEDEGSPELERYMLRHTNFIVEGWFVRFYDLFLKYKPEIVSMFAFDKVIADKVSGVISHEASDGDVRLGVHIRRGDYRTFKDGAYFYDDDTYISYIKAFIRRCGDKHVTVFICGNDPKIDKDYYRQNIPEATIVFPAGNPGEDLCLLSECNSLIGPPSTFSLVASMYHDIPLLWMHNADSSNVNNQACWGQFDKLFREII